VTDDEVQAWIARTRTAERDHRLPHDGDRASLRARLRGELDELGVPPSERDAVVEICAAEMSRLFTAQARPAPSTPPSPSTPAAPSTPPSPSTPPAPSTAPKAPTPMPAPVRVSPPTSAREAATSTASATATVPAGAAPVTTTMPPAPGPSVDPRKLTETLPRGWFRSQWRRLHWSGRVALVVLGPPVALVLGLMALCTVSPPVGATVLGATNRVFDGEVYGHDFVGFGKGRYETSPWQFTFLHPSRAAMDRLRVQCENDPGFAPPVCATVQHSYRMENQNGTFRKVVDSDKEQTWFESEACPALAVLDHQIYARDLDTGWERYRSHGCVPYDA
jgi:hypothetical protein